MLYSLIVTGSLMIPRQVYYQNWKLIHPAGFTVVFLLHICAVLLYSVENSTLPNADFSRSDCLFNLNSPFSECIL